jgi:hypothetical protein
MVLIAHIQYYISPGVLCASLRHTRNLFICLLERETSALLHVYAAAFFVPYKPVEWVS